MLDVNLDDVIQLRKGLSRYEKKAMTAINAYGRSSAITLQNDAKRRARWTDRTGQARKSITGEYIPGESLGVIRLEGYAKKQSKGTGTKKRKNKLTLKKGTGTYKISKKNNDYFQYLEYAHGKKWAVLHPTAKKALPRITKTIGNRLGKIKLMQE